MPYCYNKIKQKLTKNNGFTVHGVIIILMSCNKFQILNAYREFKQHIVFYIIIKYKWFNWNITQSWKLILKFQAII